jgi:riboflavin kinase/FMN adenylyltransferase
MLSIQHTPHFRLELPSIVTIGTFDGVHSGHQKILSRLLDLKKETGMVTAVLTFEPHPRRVLFPEQDDLKILTLTEEKLKLLERYGVDIAVVYPFTTEFSTIDAKDYVAEILVRSMKTRHLVIGYDHKFGHKRSGNIQTLRNYSAEYGYDVEEISAQDIDHIAVSSTRIRKALEEGNLKLAEEYLGHRYFMTCRVIKGKQLGRRLGYHTANLKPLSDEKLIPATGIYFVKAETDGESLYGMMSIGRNPTTDEDASIKIEVHLFDFNRDIYGRRIEVELITRLRNEEKFPGLDALKQALQKDEENCRRLIGQLKSRATV